MSEVTRIITPHDKKVADRLKRIFDQRKSTTGLTQIDLAEKTGLTQVTVSKYMNGKMAMRNAQTICNFANALGVSPEEIDPKLKIRFPTIPKTLKLTGNLDSFTLDGDTTTAIAPLKKLSESTAYVVNLDTRYEPLFPKNTNLIVDPSGILKKHRWVVLKNKGAFYLYKLWDITDRAIHVYFQEQEHLRNALVRKHTPSEDIELICPPGVLVFNLKDIETVHKLRGIEFND